jgi:hypothetical protein
VLGFIRRPLYDGIDHPESAGGRPATAAVRARKLGTAIRAESQLAILSWRVLRGIHRWWLGELWMRPRASKAKNPSYAGAETSLALSSARGSGPVFRESWISNQGTVCAHADR